MSPSDAEALHALIVDNFDLLKPWFNWVYDNYTFDETLGYLERCTQQVEARTDLPYGIWYRQKLSGAIGLHKMDWENRTGRIGYWLDSRVTGKGIVSRSTQVLVNYAFEDLGMHRIEIRCAPDNVRSRAIPERLGFTAEGTHRDALWMRDHFQSLVMYALVRS